MNLIEKNERMKELIEMLNKYRDAYYNQTESLVSDYEYDCLFDELQRLEDYTFQFTYSNCRIRSKE